MSQILPTYLVDKAGVPIDGTNPLPTAGGGGGSTTADQGAPATAPDAWYTRDEDARASLASLDGKAPALGQAVMAASVPVTVASDQESLVVDIEGLYQNGVREGLVTLSSANGLNVSVIEPLSAFGEMLVAESTPRIQIDAVYGLLTTDHETLTDGVSGSVTASNSMFVCQTGTSVGGYGVLRSRRMLRYRAGEGCSVKFTASFTSPVANSLQVAGAFTSTDALFVGYSGTTFGYMRRIPGAVAIWRLTVTNGATGAETITVRLDGVNFTVSASGALSTTATAQLIAARVGGYTGWSSSVSPTSNGATVTFLQSNPATTGSSFTLTSTGGATGTFAELQAGAANDSATGFVAQTAWNVDRLDGSNGAFNPSGMLLDPTKLNVYQIIYPYLGAGAIVIQVMTPTRQWTTVHIDRYPNTYTVPSMRNPTLQLGWVSASLGSTTNLTVKGASAGGFVQGQRRPFRDPVGVSGVFTGVSGTENAYLLLRNRAEFANTVNFRQLLLQTARIAVETTNRIARIRYVLNPTLSATVNWQYINQSTSSTEYAIPTGVTITGGTQIAADDVVTQAAISFADLDLRMEPGDVLAVAIQTASSTATVAVSINQHEE